MHVLTTIVACCRQAPTLSKNILALSLGEPLWLLRWWRWDDEMHEVL